MSAQIFQTALGITSPWFVADVDFDQSEKILKIEIDFISAAAAFK